METKERIIERVEWGKKMDLGAQRKDEERQEEKETTEE